MLLSQEQVFRTIYIYVYEYHLPATCFNEMTPTSLNHVGHCYPELLGLKPNVKSLLIDIFHQYRNPVSDKLWAINKILITRN